MNPNFYFCSSQNDKHEKVKRMRGLNDKTFYRSYLLIAGCIRLMSLSLLTTYVARSFKLLKWSYLGLLQSQMLD